MTISKVTERKQYIGDGTTVDFAFPYRFFENSDLRVYIDSDLQVLTAQYTVSNTGTESGGTVTFLTAPASASRVTIISAIPYSQTQDYNDNKRFPAQGTETALDWRTLLSLQNLEKLRRALAAPEYDDPALDMTLPAAAARAGKALTFGATGQPGVLAVSTGLYLDPVAVYDNVSALTLSTEAARGAGVVWQAGQFFYEEAAPGASDHHLTTAGGVKLRVAGAVADLLAFDADDTGAADATTQIKRALTYSASSGAISRALGTFAVSGDIGPEGAIKADWNDATIQFDLSTPGDYAEIQTNPSTGSYTGSGKYVGFDTAGSTNSQHRGRVHLKALGSDGNGIAAMTLADRVRIVDDMVALSSSLPGGGFSNWEGVEISGWDYPMWRGDFNGSAGTILPYTLTNWGQIYIHHCANMPFSGLTGNGFDSLHIDVLRLVRNGGDLDLLSTELEVGQFFTIGFTEADFEAPTASVDVGGALTLSASLSGLANGDYIAFQTGGLDHDSNSIGYVGKLSGLSGTTGTLAPAPDAAISAENFVVNPSRAIDIARSALKAQVFYIEQMWTKGVKLRVGGQFLPDVFKYSGGAMSFLYQAPVVVTGREDTLVKIPAIHPVSEANTSIKRVVAVGSTRTSTNPVAYSSGRVEVTSAMKRAEAEISRKLIEIVTLDSDDIDSGYIDASGEYNQELTLIKHFSDCSVVMSGIADDGEWGGDAYSFGGNKTGPTFGPKIADLSDAIVNEIGNFSSGVKTAGAAGYLRHSETMTAGARYMVQITIEGWTAGSPRVRMTDGALSTPATSAPNDHIDANGAPFARNPGGRYTLYFTALPGIGGVDIQAFTNDAYTVTQFDLYEVLSA